jgi:hypothetical protein
MNKKDKKIIEDSEARGIPIFVLTAKDMISVSTIDKYRDLCKAEECGQDHISEIGQRIDEFRAWQKANPDLVKLPD